MSSSLSYNGIKVTDATFLTSFHIYPSARIEGKGMDDPMVQGWSFQDRHVTQYQYKENITNYGIGDQPFLVRPLHRPRRQQKRDKQQLDDEEGEEEDNNNISNSRDELIFEDRNGGSMHVEWLVQFKLPPFDGDRESFVHPDFQFFVHTREGIDGHYMGKNCHLLLLSEEEVEKGEYGTIQIKDHTWTWVNATIYRLDEEYDFVLRDQTTIDSTLPSLSPSASPVDLNSILLLVGTGLLGVAVGALITFCVLGREKRGQHAYAKASTIDQEED